jgi:DNA-binding beta-propeller fold protein YncE
VPGALIVLLLGLGVVPAASQVGGTPDMTPTNDLPNPYQTTADWAKLPSGRIWGSTNAVAIDRDGTSVWVAERCGGNMGACVQRTDLDPVIKFDASGNVVTSFGKGMVTWPHGIHIDRSGNVWVVDGQSNAGGRGRGGGGAGGAPGRGAGAPATPDRIYGSQVLEFSPTGQLLMSLGELGGNAADGFFSQPNAVVIAPNGDIFVSEGHSANARARILVFDASGRMLRTFGSNGAGPGQLRVPHDLAFDSQGRLFVADRGNNRIQIFSQTGELLDVWYQFSRPSGLWIDANDVLYVADSESGSTSLAPTRTAWKRGIRIGSARTGQVSFLVPDPNAECTGSCAAEEIAVDRNGVVYGGEVGPPGRLQRYVKAGG